MMMMMMITITIMVMFITTNVFQRMTSWVCAGQVLFLHSSAPVAFSTTHWDVGETQSNRKSQVMLLLVMQP